MARHCEPSVWVLEIKLGSPGKVVHALDRSAICPDQQFRFISVSSGQREVSTVGSPNFL